MAKRLISSAVGIAIGISVLFFADTILLNIVIAILAVIGTIELLKVAGCLEFKGITATAVVYSAVSQFLLKGVIFSRSYFDMASAAAVIIMFSFYLSVHKKMSIEKLYYAIATTFFLNYSLSCIYLTYQLSEVHGVIYIVLILCGAWIADSGAYFTGTFCGKHKLCPEISPKKTIEGFIGGVITNGIFMIVFNLVYIKFFAEGCTVNYISSFFLGLICALIGTVGDLSASLIKRHYNVKDFGKLMPGHGGFMDRFDSVLFVAPFMYAFLRLFNIYI